MPQTSSPTSSEPSRWSRSNGALAAWLVMAVLLIAVAFSPQAAGEDGDEATTDILFRYEFAVASLVVYAVIVGLTWLVARSFGDAREALGLRPFPRRWLWTALGVGLASLVVSATLEPVLRAGEEQGLAPDRWREDRVLAFALNAVVVVLIVPFAEELFFRGLGVRVLGFLGGAVAIVGTALVFALSHGILVGIPALGFFALGLGWVRYRSESVWPGYAAHAAYNGVGILAAALFALNEEESAALALLF
jgi:membrane protease YdiL (CAAX protease family)